MSKWTAHLSPSEATNPKFSVTDEAGHLITGGLSAADAQRMCEAWEIVRPHLGALIESPLLNVMAELSKVAEILGDEP